MASFDEIIQNRLVSDRTREPLRLCSVCEMLMGDDDCYTIAKAYHKGKIVMEAVQCFHCQMASKDYASEQSLENIMLYSGRRFNDFMQDSIKRKIYHLEDPSCLVTGEFLKPADTFELYCFKVPGAELADDDFVLVGPTAIEQMSELLSKETKESWGRFTDSLAPDTPEIVVSPMFIG